MPRNKFTRKWILKVAATMLLIFLAGIFIFLVVCIGHTSRQETIPVEFYYVSSGNSVMKSEEKKILQATHTEVISNVLAELKKGPKTESFINSIPKDVEFQKALLKDSTVSVDVSPEYSQMKNGEELICRSSIVWTLTSLDFIDNVEITINGKPLLRADGTPIGIMNRNNVIIDAVIAPESKRYEVVKLYFANADRTALVTEKREIEISQNQPKEKSVMEQLIAGPQEEGHYTTIPPETKVRDITTTEDGVCYVNLSDGFLGKHNNGTDGESLTVYSIVNSLAGLPNIQKVQFLIEGEKLEEFQGNLDFSKPFEANPRLKE